jgi:hypothetical protein
MREFFPPRPSHAGRSGVRGASHPRPPGAPMTPRAARPVPVAQPVSVSVTVGTALPVAQPVAKPSANTTGQVVGAVAQAVSAIAQAVGRQRRPAGLVSAQPVGVVPLVAAPVLAMPVLAMPVGVPTGFAPHAPLGFDHGHTRHPDPHHGQGGAGGDWSDDMPVTDEHDDQLTDRTPDADATDCELVTEDPEPVADQCEPQKENDEPTVDDAQLTLDECEPMVDDGEVQFDDCGGAMTEDDFTPEFDDYGGLTGETDLDCGVPANEFGGMDCGDMDFGGDAGFDLSGSGDFGGGYC